MRIKCPNSEIFLDLPDGRMDMKFNCPACNHTHRVTVSITSPGQAPARPPVAAESPKKYATGDYPPVVDIPIDADFVLVEKSADQTLDGSGGSGTAAFAAAEAPAPAEQPQTPAPEVEARFGQALADVHARRRQRVFAAVVIVALAAVAGWFGARFVRLEIARNQTRQGMERARAAYQEGRLADAQAEAGRVEARLAELAEAAPGQTPPADKLPLWASEWPGEIAHYRLGADALAEFTDALARGAEPVDDFANLLSSGRWELAVAEAERRIETSRDGELDDVWRRAARQSLDDWMIAQVARAARFIPRPQAQAATEAATEAEAPSDADAGDEARTEKDDASPNPPPRSGVAERENAPTEKSADVDADTAASDSEDADAGPDVSVEEREAALAEADAASLGDRLTRMNALAEAARGRISEQGRPRLERVVDESRTTLAGETLRAVAAWQRAAAADCQRAAADQPVAVARAFDGYARRLALVGSLPPALSTPVNDALARQDAALSAPVGLRRLERIFENQTRADRVLRLADNLFRRVDEKMRPGGKADAANDSGPDEVADLAAEFPGLPAPANDAPADAPVDADVGESDVAVAADAAGADAAAVVSTAAVPVIVRRLPEPAVDWERFPAALRPPVESRAAVARFLRLRAVLDFAENAARFDDHPYPEREGDLDYLSPLAAARLRARAAADGAPAAEAFAEKRISRLAAAARRIEIIDERLRERVQRGPGEDEQGRLNRDAALLALRILRIASEADDFAVDPEGLSTGARSADAPSILRMGLLVRAAPAAQDDPVGIAPPQGLSFPGAGLPPPGDPAAPSTARFGHAPTLLSVAKRGDLTAAGTVAPLTLTVRPAELGQRLRFEAFGYRFVAAQSNFPRKIFHAVARAALELRALRIDPALHRDWEIVEGPGAPLALRRADKNGDGPAARVVLFAGRVQVAESAGGADADAGDDLRDAVEAFLRAARALARVVEADDLIPREVRAILAPVLNGAFGPLDARDYLDGDFCRRLVEGDYIELHAPEHGSAVSIALAEYREALARLEAGRPAFRFTLADGRVATALSSLDAVLKQPLEGEEEINPAARADSDNDPAPAYFWRINTPAGAAAGAGAAPETVFVEAFPERAMYGLQLASYWPGEHAVKPKDTLPAYSLALHALSGALAGHRTGADAAEGQPERWSQALGRDWAGQEPYGQNAWGFPPHLVVRNDQGDVVALATPAGVLESPDFGPTPPGPAPRGDDFEPDHPWAARRAAQDAWLSRVAELLREPGQMALLFRQFFRYAVDSPIPRLPTLLGNHLATGDVHQTVHEVLDRKVMGRFLGDCDDLAEFFQNLATRQGRLSFVMSLPGHAAAGWVETDPPVNLDNPLDPLPPAPSDADKPDAASTSPSPEAKAKANAANAGGSDQAGGADDADDAVRRTWSAPSGPEYRFIVLQTGPALRFVGDSLDEVVTAAYSYFDQGQGFSNFSVAAVPILLRFAGEQTRTPFVLEDRIYLDRPYAETMVRIQGYWHSHTYWRALREMRDMIATDRAIGNLKETASLYERVGHFEESEALRREELAAAPDDDRVVKSSTWMDLAGLYRLQGDRRRFLAAVDQLRRLQNDMRRERQGAQLQQTMQQRFIAAQMLVGQGYPLFAWGMLGSEANMAAAYIQRGLPFPRLFAVFFNSIHGSLRRRAESAEKGEEGVKPLDANERRALEAVDRLLAEGYRTTFFQSDDGWNDILTKYAVLGEYALAREGGDAGVERLVAEDGPAADLARVHTRRGRDIDEQDWAWLRLNPRLYMQAAFHRLDPRDNPQAYDPSAARRLLEALPAVFARMEAAGSAAQVEDDMLRGNLALSILSNDEALFRRTMGGVRERDWADSYDTAAMVFGQLSRHVPLADFPGYLAAFREYVPDRQHHFKAAYRAFDAEADGHARLLAQSAVAAFPDDPHFAAEARDFESMLETVAQRRAARQKRLAGEESSRRAESGTVREAPPAPPSAPSAPPSTPPAKPEEKEKPAVEAKDGKE